MDWSNATPIRGIVKDNFACCFCDKTYKLAKELKVHNIMAHKRCLAALHLKYTLYYTIRLDITDLKCKICGQTLPTLENLLSHLEIHGKVINKDIKNQLIPFTFPNNNFTCIQCNRIFKYFKSLTQHMIEHYKIFECNDCGRGFMNKRDITKHVMRHQTEIYTCAYCPKQFLNREQVISHERLVHRLNSKQLKCRYCTERFSYKKLRNKHEVECHGVLMEKFECKICHKTLSSDNRLIEHMKIKHLKETRFYCEICSKGFYFKRAMEDHMITHTKEKKFKCELCPKLLSRQRALVVHLKKHFGEKRFHCEYCGVRFIQKVELKSHLRAKHGEAYEVV